MSEFRSRRIIIIIKLPLYLIDFVGLSAIAPNYLARSVGQPMYLVYAIVHPLSSFFRIFCNIVANSNLVLPQIWIIVYGYSLCQVAYTETTMILTES